MFVYVRTERWMRKRESVCVSVFVLKVCAILSGYVRIPKGNVSLWRVWVSLCVSVALMRRYLHKNMAHMLFSPGMTWHVGHLRSAAVIAASSIAFFRFLDWS